MVNKIIYSEFITFVDEYYVARNSIIKNNLNQKTSKLSHSILQQWEKMDSLVSRLSGRLGKLTIESSDNKWFLIKDDHPIFNNFIFNIIKENSFKESFNKKIVFSDLSYKSTKWLIDFYEGKSIDAICWKSFFELAYFADKSLDSSLTLNLQKNFLAKLKENKEKSVFESCPRRTAWFIENLRNNLINFLESASLKMEEIEYLVDVLNKKDFFWWEKKLSLNNNGNSYNLVNNLILLKFFVKFESISTLSLLKELAPDEQKKILLTAYNSLIFLIEGNKNENINDIDADQCIAFQNVLSLFLQEPVSSLESTKQLSFYEKISLQSNGVLSKIGLYNATILWDFIDQKIEVQIEYSDKFKNKASLKATQLKNLTEEMLKFFTNKAREKFFSRGSLNPFLDAVLFMHGRTPFWKLRQVSQGGITSKTMEVKRWPRFDPDSFR